MHAVEFAHAWDDPLEVIAMKGEGTLDYQAQLFIPSHTPFDLFNRDAKIGAPLYVKRIFIMGDCNQLMPRYLRFVNGAVDSQDLSLNVSAESCSRTRRPSGRTDPAGTARHRPIASPCRWW